MSSKHTRTAQGSKRPPDHLTVLAGDKGTLQDTSVPASVLTGVFTQMQHSRASLHDASHTLHESVTDLATDWAPRRRCFWTDILAALHALHPPLQACNTWATAVSFGEEKIASFGIRLDVLIQVNALENLIDEAGIAITAYLPVCQSVQAKHLQQRHALLKDLRTLTQALLTLRALLGPEGQRRCAQEYQRCLHERAAWLAKVSRGDQKPEGAV